MNTQQKYKNMTEMFNYLNEVKESNQLHYLSSMPIQEKDLKLVKMGIDLRSQINIEYKKLGNIASMNRGEMETKIAFQSMLTEILFTKHMWDLYVKLGHSTKNRFEIRSPEVACIFVNKKEEDFYIKYNHLNQSSTTLMFDMKSQFLENKIQFININEKAHSRFLEHNSDFYIVGLIDGNIDDFSTCKNLHFVVITKKYFEKKAKLISTSNSNFFSPHFKIDMADFHNLLSTELVEKNILENA